MRVELSLQPQYFHLYILLKEEKRRRTTRRAQQQPEYYHNMSNLPPGYRFYPTEEELVGFYLRNKLDRRREDIDRLIPVVDIYSLDPWELPSILGEGCNGDEQWFFFSPRQEREAQGGRPNRITPSGYWKATGTPGYVFSSDNRKMGVKRTMVFYQGKAPTGNKTKWKLNEYKALEESTTSSATPKARHEVSLCRVYVTSGSVRSFDRRPMVAATGETLHREDSTPMSGVSNNEGASGSNSSGLAQENPSMEEQVGHLYPSPVEETGDDLNMLDDLDDLWNSFTWD